MSNIQPECTCDSCKETRRVKKELIAAAPETKRQRDALFDICKQLQRYNEAAKNGQLGAMEDNGHEYWCSIMDDIDVVVGEIE